MKIRSFFQTFRAPGIVTAVLAFFLGISYIDEVVPSAGAGGFFQYKIGFLFPWLTIPETEEAPLICFSAATKEYTSISSGWCCMSFWCC